MTTLVSATILLNLGVLALVALAGWLLWQESLERRAEARRIDLLIGANRAHFRVGMDRYDADVQAQAEARRL